MALDHSLHRTLDWRFLATLAFLLMVAYLVLTGVTAIQQDAKKDRQIDALIATAREDRAEAAEQQLVLLRRIDAYDARQRSLLAWLRRNGIDIPTRFVEVPATPAGRRPATPNPPAPSTQPPQSVPTTAPGKSGTHAHRGKKGGNSEQKGKKP